GLLHYRTQVRDRAASRHAHGSAEPRGGEFPGEETARLGAKSPVPRGAEADHRLVLLDQGQGRSEAHLQQDAHRKIRPEGKQGWQTRKSTLSEICRLFAMTCPCPLAFHILLAAVDCTATKIAVWCFRPVGAAIIVYLW